MPVRDDVIAVLDYGIGNLRSAEKALQHLGAPAVLTGDPDVVRRARGVVLPGVGAVGRCAERLRESGLAEPTLEAIDAGTPFLGVCVGMQLLFDGSDESPDVPGLGVLAGRVTRLPDVVTVPHMGWNTLTITPGSRLLAGLGRDAVVLLRPLVRPPSRRPGRGRGHHRARPAVRSPRSSGGRCGPPSSTPRRAARPAYAVLAGFAAACGFTPRVADAPRPRAPAA